MFYIIVRDRVPSNITNFNDAKDALNDANVEVYSASTVQELYEKLTPYYTCPALETAPITPVKKPRTRKPVAKKTVKTPRKTAKKKAA